MDGMRGKTDRPVPIQREQLDVIGTSIRWLSQHGEDENGIPEYGLRFFTIQPGGQIPIHNHFYHQTMYILSGEFECWEFDEKPMNSRKKWCADPELRSISRACSPTA